MKKGQLLEPNQSLSKHTNYYIDTCTCHTYMPHMVFLVTLLMSSRHTPLVPN